MVAPVLVVAVVSRENEAALAARALPVVAVSPVGVVCAVFRERRVALAGEDGLV